MAAKENAEDLIDTPMWDWFVKKAEKRANTAKNQLFTVPGLDEQHRLMYHGQLLGIWDLIESVYLDAGRDVPQEIRAFYRGKP